MFCWGGKVHYSGVSLFFCWPSLGLVVWPKLGDPFVSQNPIEVCASHSPERIPGCTYTTCSYGWIKLFVQFQWILKPFNCLQPVLSFSLAASIHWFAQSYCEAANATITTTMLRLLLLYQFWKAEICICHKSRPTRDETRGLQIAPPRTLKLAFFSILPAFHTQDTFALVLNFEVGHFARHFLHLYFFIFVLQWKEFILHTLVVTFLCSRLSGSLPVFYPAGDGC